MKKKILVVDDEPEIRKALALRLGYVGFGVEHAENGRQAVDSYITALDRNQAHHLIILDIMMPEVDGIEALRMIREEETERKIPEDQRVPVLMLTAVKQPWIEEEAFVKGCNAYILKPFMSVDLISKAEDMMNLEIVRN